MGRLGKACGCGSLELRSVKNPGNLTVYSGNASCDVLAGNIRLLPIAFLFHPEPPLN